MARGRHASSPLEIPLSGWKDILLRVKDEIASDHVSLIAAGVAFYGLLALFPAVTAMMALAGLMLDPSQVTEQLSGMLTVIPEAAGEIIIDQAIEVTGSEEQGLGWAFLIGFGLALYSASKGMGSLMEGLNVAYDEDETRGFIKRTLTTLALTLLMTVGLVFGIMAAVGVPAIVEFVGLGPMVETLLVWGRWVILAVIAIAGLAALYRYGPSRDDAEWQWLSVGSITACVLWLGASIGFSYYVSNFGSYNETFGSMAGIIILLMWLWLSSYIVLLGAELNAEIEAQTAEDTTVGPDEPMGQRGAEKADRLGEAKGA